jgi:hypothetical protein
MTRSFLLHSWRTIYELCVCVCKYVCKCPGRPRLVGDDVLLLGLVVLDLGTFVEDLLGLIVDDDSKTHILSQFDDVVEDLSSGGWSNVNGDGQPGSWTAHATPLLTTKPS